MKCLVYSNTGMTSKQIGLTAEVIEDLINEKHEVKFVLCDNELFNCYFNKTHNVLGCASCQSRLRFILKQAGLSNSDFKKLMPINKIGDNSFPEFKSREELVAFEYDGINIGRGVASSIISFMRDYNITSKKHGDLINIELEKSINVTENFKQFISEYKPDSIYIFNGRFSEVWPVVQLCKKHAIPFYNIEAGSGKTYEIFENHLPHSISYRENSIRELWDKADVTNRSLQAIEWYESKQKGEDKFEISYTTKQIQELLPKGFNTNKFNIAIMNSSEDEIKVIDEWQTDLYNSQNEGLLKIVDAFKNNSEYHFYLRVHPNLGTVENIQMNEIRNFNFPNLTVIPPESKVDSYHLVKACNKIITFGSSIGIEATYIGKPSILYGNSFYKNLDCVYVPKSTKELIDLIKSNDLKAYPRESTYPYAFYLSCYGRIPKYFKYDGLKNSYYKNKKLKFFYATTPILMIRYLKNLKLWKQLFKIFNNKSLSLSDILKYK